MKKILSAVAIGLLMLFSYLVGSRHKDQAVSAAEGSRRPLYWVDPMHPNYKSDRPGIAPDCGMELKPVYADEQKMELAPASATSSSSDTVSVAPRMEQLVGIRTEVVHRGTGPSAIRVLGRVLPEDTRIYRIDSGTEGFIRETFNDSVGTFVKKDEKLASCYGPEYLSVASGFLAATAAVPGAVGKDGSRTMPLPGAVSKQGVSSIQGYSDRLRNLGMSEVQIRQMAESRLLPESIDIVAPTDGLIISRNVTPGQHFDRAAEFYRIADLSRVWIVAEIFGSDAQKIHPGSIAHVTLSEQGKSFTARVSGTLPEIDPITRTLQLRLEADNPGLALRPDMFVDIKLPVSMPPGLTVPVDAVIDSGVGQRVFVERAPGIFESRPVQTGWHDGDRVEIVHGLTEGEHIISEGTFLLDSESRLKAVVQPQSQPADKKVQPDVNTAGERSKRRLSAQLQHQLAFSSSGHRP